MANASKNTPLKIKILVYIYYRLSWENKAMTIPFKRKSTHAFVTTNIIYAACRTIVYRT